MSQLPESDPFSLDDRLRSAYAADDAAADPAPPARMRIWAGLQPNLHPVAAPAPRRTPLWAGLGGLVIGMLLMWWWLPLTVPSTTSVIAGPGLVSEQSAIAERNPASAERKPAKAGSGLAKAGSNPASAKNTLAAAASKPAKAESGPAKAGNDPAFAESTPAAAENGPAEAEIGVAVPLVLQGLIVTETTQAGLAADSAAETRAARRQALLTERAALAALTHRADSLLLTLGELPQVPPALAVAPAAPADSVVPTPRRRWSVALSFAPERNFFGLRGPAEDTLSAVRRVHEQGRAGYNAALMAEYRIDERLSVGVGVGVASYGAELRLTDHRTRISTHFDSSTVRSATVTTVIRVAYSTRTVPDSILAPILNVNQQVISYHYLPTTRLDTVWTHIENTQVDSVTKKTYTPVITTRDEVSARILRPNYRFLTLPLLVRYRLGRATDWTSSPTAPRWWADVAVGAQLQWFLGGTQASTLDGRTYQTERVGSRGGPFRPLNVALTGAVAFNYALTPRLSASLAPTLRWQVESVYKASTNLTQRPMATGVQVGIRYAF